METSSKNWIQATCDWLRLSTSGTPSEAITGIVGEASSDELESLLEVLEADLDNLAASPQRLRILMQAVATRLVKQANQEMNEFPAVGPATLARLYERMVEIDANSAAHALQVLAAQCDEESIDTLAGILSDAPPQDWQAVALAVSPLWNADSQRLELFYERLDDVYLHPSTMSVLLDLAGYSLRKGKLSLHPWAQRQAELNSLLTSVVRRLTSLEADPTKFGSEVAEVQRILADSVSLTVSLCDALGLIGDPQSESSLREALKLSHRRIQAEAAGALARLGFETGRQRLIELAADPVARKRVVGYAEELGFAEADIDPTLRHPSALAESDLAAWLASSDQYGFPPSRIELIDSRTLYWPSYDEPQECYLFKYTYAHDAVQVSNLGLAGPITHAFNADLCGLPIDDVYAAFAGWQAEHDDIFEIPMALLNPGQRRQADRLLDALASQQLEIVESLALTFFLGELAVLAQVSSHGRTMLAISDGIELLTMPISYTPTSLTPEILLAVYRGRKLLRTFNV